MWAREGKPGRDGRGSGRGGGEWEGERRVVTNIRGGCEKQSPDAPDGPSGPPVSVCEPDDAPHDLGHLCQNVGGSIYTLVASAGVQAHASIFGH